MIQVIHVSISKSATDWLTDMTTYTDAIASKYVLWAENCYLSSLWNLNCPISTFFKIQLKTPIFLTIFRQNISAWARTRDMSVLTVGGLVFSSDPRVQVIIPLPVSSDNTVSGVCRSPWWSPSWRPGSASTSSRSPTWRGWTEASTSARSTILYPVYNSISGARSTLTRTGASLWCSRS